MSLSVLFLCLLFVNVSNHVSTLLRKHRFSVPSLAGKVHPGWTGKPRAGQEVFCAGTEAEQQKHEGLVRPLHGKICTALQKQTLKTGVVIGSRWASRISIFRVGKPPVVILL